MPSPGRQKASSPWNIFLALLFFFTSSASAAVLGLDFGTLNLKASLVKPGIPLEIVLTKDSKRKETAAVAFKPSRDSSNNVIAELGSYPERAYGGDALALQGRMPGEVFPNLKPLLGLSWNGEQSEVVNLYTSRYPAVQAKQDGKLGTTLFTCSAFNKAEEPWSVEELLAMELGNIKNNAHGRGYRHHCSRLLHRRREARH
jgi:hypoxia up-regulated 1